MVERFLDTEEVAGSIPASRTKQITMHYTEVNGQFATDFFKLTDEAKKICITAHISPDEDSMASLLAVYRLLSLKYPEKELRMIYGTERIARYESFQNFEKIEFVVDLADYLEKFDLVICLDGSQYHRFTSQPGKLEKFQGKKICIDHHSSPIDKFDLSLITPQISSTSEVIYLAFCSSEALAEKGRDKEIDKPLAEIFLLGILGDTGNFTYLRPDQTETLITAKKLIEDGQIEIAEFQSRYRTIPPRLLTLVEEYLKTTQFHEMKNWLPFQSSFIKREFVQTHNFTDREIAEAGAIYIAYYVRAITGYSWGFVVTPRADGSCNASSRSLPGSVNVRELAERMGIGGGHDRAAGGTFREAGKILEPEECLNKILEWLRQNEPVLG